MMLARRLRRLPRPGVRCVSEAELNPNRELGFSFPAPRVLGEIAKVDLLRQEDPDAIRDIWRKHHEGSENALATDLAAEDFRTILARGKESPFFVFPVHREGGFFTLLSQFQDKYCLFTYLDDYKANPATAQPYLTLTLYDDLVEDKGLALARADYGLLLGREEATRLVLLLRRYYLDDERYKTVDTFNNVPQAFDINSYFEEVAREEVAEQ